MHNIRDARPVLPLQHGELGRHQAVVERADGHVLEDEASLRAVEADGEEAIDVRVAGAGQHLDLGLDLVVGFPAQSAIVRSVSVRVWADECAG